MWRDKDIPTSTLTTSIPVHHLYDEDTKKKDRKYKKTETKK